VHIQVHEVVLPYLLHIIRSLKPGGKAACILPHGVLFRGNAEAEIRKNLIQRGLLRAIIGLPPNLFYGTGIPACIVLVDKESAGARRGVFMVDASRGFVKDGPKNRLREMEPSNSARYRKDFGEKGARKIQPR
jgi:type I restriction enzyme M protein